MKKVWPATLLKKSLWHGCFPVNFAKYLRTPFLFSKIHKLSKFFIMRGIEISGWTSTHFLKIYHIVFGVT